MTFVVQKCLFKSDTCLSKLELEFDHFLCHGTSLHIKEIEIMNGNEMASFKYQMQLANGQFVIMSRS